MGILDSLFGESKNKKLIWACAVGRHEEVINLLKQGADINTKGDEGQTALITSIMSNNYGIVKMLIDYGADIDTPFLDGVTPLMCAVRVGSLEVIWQLINMGAEINSMRSDGETALLTAVVGNNYDATNLLLKNGADVDKRNIDNETALSFAVIKGYKEIVDLLIKSGADVNTFGDYELTPLMRASSEGHIEIVELLLENGANINSIGSGGKTALLIALNKQHYDIARVLIEKGADVTIVESEGADALYWARNDGNQEIERLIVESIDKQIAHKRKMAETQVDQKSFAKQIENEIECGKINRDEIVSENRKMHIGLSRGNTVGNISNGGYAVNKGDYIYYVNANDGNKIYEANINTNESRIICHDVSAFLNYYDGWLYYQNRSDHNTIYRMQTDGSSRTKISHDNSSYINICDGWVYYINCVDENEDEISNIIKLSSDGSERKKIGDISTAAEIYVSNGWIYYTTFDYDETYRVNTDGGAESLVISGFASSINICDGWIYYIDDDRIYKTYEDGSNPTMLEYYDLPDVEIYDLPYSINVVGNWIYYSAESTSNNLTFEGIVIGKMHTDGSKKTHILRIGNEDLPDKLNNYFGTGDVELNVTDEWLYFTICGDNEVKAYKAKIDGSCFNLLNMA